MSPSSRRTRFLRAASRLEALIDRNRGPGARRIAIVPYRSCGREGELVVRGRVLAEKRIMRVRSAEPVWRALVNAYRRFQSDEIAGAAVRATYGETSAVGVTDEEGYFSLTLSPPKGDGGLWREVALELTGGEARSTALVLVPPAGAAFGVISDIDDTIVQTGAASLRAMVSATLLKNAATRVAFEGVADLYQRLHRGVNPLFYVSSSPWNLYDLLADYMEINAIPAGPMFLQDWGLTDESILLAPHALHKARAIQRLLDYYPELKFVAIGDSGQHDPEIYLDVARGNPGRLLATVIRDVSAGPRDRDVAGIAAQSAVVGVPMGYFPDSAGALFWLRELGLAV